MSDYRPPEHLAYIDDMRYSILEQPVRLRDIRAKMQQIEDFVGARLFKRSVLGEIARIVVHYYPLPEQIAFYRREQEVYREHVRKGDFDGSNDRNVVILGAHDLCSWWLDRKLRYPYGDVRLLRPIIGEALMEAAEWRRIPFPEEAAALGEWYEQLGQGGVLYPTDEHLDYVRRFEAFAEEIIWDSRDRDYITIVNFPAPPNAQPPVEWWSTQHVLE